MAHREYHEQEVEALRRAAKEEGEAKVGAVWFTKGRTCRREFTFTASFTYTCSTLIIIEVGEPGK